MERPLVAALRTYNPRAVSLVQISVSGMMSPSERSVSPAVAVNLRLDGSPPYLHSFPFVLQADSLFPHLSRCCFMSDTKAFNQEVLIYDSSERCNLRFSGGSPEKKTGCLSAVKSSRGTSQLWSFASSPALTPKGFGLFNLRWREEVTEYINDTSYSPPPPPPPPPPLAP